MTQGSNTCHLHCQADSLPLSHLGFIDAFYYIDEVLAIPSFLTFFFQLRNSIGLCQMFFLHQL